MEVSIVGGGVAGLILALTLHQNSVPCRIYELRKTADIANPGALGFAPNALRPLESLGLYEKLESLSWKFDHVEFRDASDQIIDQFPCGGPSRYGYDTLRIVRTKLHDVLLAAVEDAKIPIISGKKFSHVVSSTADGVTFAFTDNTTVTSSLLVGADGIYSTVREAIAPGVRPEYKGQLALAVRLTRNPWLDLPQSPELAARLRAVCINFGTKGAFLSCVQSANGEEIAFGLDRPYPSQSREDWDTLLNDQQRQYELLMENHESWPEPIQVLLRSVKPENMYRSWPFHAIPDLENWCTPDTRVVLVGDAAHAIPPSAGQGACMAVEDAYSLGCVVGQARRDNVDVDSGAWKEKIVRWQDHRRDRIGKVRLLTRQMANSRLPAEQKEKLSKGECFVSGEQAELSWLYAYDFHSHCP